MKNRIVGTIAIALLIAVLIAAFMNREAEGAGNIYACWWVEDELMMSGYFHPAALEGGPARVFQIELGEDCDATPTPVPTPTVVPTPIPTPTVVPTPVPPVCRLGTTSHQDEGLQVWWFYEVGEPPCGFGNDYWGILYIYGQRGHYIWSSY